jgi:hypothetical protein
MANSRVRKWRDKSTRVFYAEIARIDLFIWSRYAK